MAQCCVENRIESIKGVAKNESVPNICMVAQLGTHIDLNKAISVVDIVTNAKAKQLNHRKRKLGQKSKNYRILKQKRLRRRVLGRTRFNPQQVVKGLEAYLRNPESLAAHEILTVTSYDRKRKMHRLTEEDISLLNKLNSWSLCKPSKRSRCL